MEEISEEPAFICDDLDGLLRGVDEGRARDLQEESSQSVVRLYVSRAREKGSESHSFLSISQKGFLKTFRRASGSRRTRKSFRIS